ncbi:MAG: nucleotidyltransferase domain-containing protein [Formosimonas sp.]
MKYGLKPETVVRMCAVLAQYLAVESAILYGSRAKGTQRNGSDIDLTLLGADLTHADLNRVALALDDLSLPYQIDLSLFSQIDNLELIEHIRRVGVVFYQRTQT